MAYETGRLCMGRSENLHEQDPQGRCPEQRCLERHEGIVGAFIALSTILKRSLRPTRIVRGSIEAVERPADPPPVSTETPRTMLKLAIVGAQHTGGALGLLIRGSSGRRLTSPIAEEVGTSGTASLATTAGRERPHCATRSLSHSSVAQRPSVGRGWPASASSPP